MSRLSAAALLSILVPLVATAEDKAAPKGDLAKLQGAWTAKVGPERNLDALLTVKGNQPTVREQIETLVAAPQGDFPPSRTDAHPGLRAADPRAGFGPGRCHARSGHFRAERNRRQGFFRSDQSSGPRN